jgi:DNA-binding MarR family transcriptional regulator
MAVVVDDAYTELHDAPGRARGRTDWTLLSNHGHVLVCIAKDPDSRLRDIARHVGITERAVFGIVEDLEHGGMIQRTKIGRRNRYSIDLSQSMRHELTAGHTIGDLLGVLVPEVRDAQR